MPASALASDNRLATRPAAAPTRLVVFSDDWARHPSSSQHLITHLLRRYPAAWVNTIGTRKIKLSREDLAKAAVKLRQWLRPPARGDTLPPNLTVVTPRMYPGFRRAWQRKLNAKLISRCVNAALGPRAPHETRVAITSIPITADLPEHLDVDRWVYYCVDDFSVWPGLDGSVMDQLERKLVRHVHAAAAVSQTLVQRLHSMGCPSTLLTHGIDLDHWQSASPARTTALPAWFASLPRPILLFWGVVDQRLDIPCCLALAKNGGSLLLLGPHQSPDPRLLSTPNIHAPGPVPYALLPAFAAHADALVMPYADLPVTRAIQPLKFKEYMATGKPVIVPKLPATIEWSDAADVVNSIDHWLNILPQRIHGGIPPSQQLARLRLNSESWQSKAAAFEQLLLATAN